MCTNICFSETDLQFLLDFLHNCAFAYAYMYDSASIRVCVGVCGCVGVCVCVCRLWLHHRSTVAARAEQVYQGSADSALRSTGGELRSGHTHTHAHTHTHTHTLSIASSPKACMLLRTVFQSSPRHTHNTHSHASIRCTTHTHTHTHTSFWSIHLMEKGLDVALVITGKWCVELCSHRSHCPHWHVVCVYVRDREKPAGVCVSLQSVCFVHLHLCPCASVNAPYYNMCRVWELDFHGQS